MHWKFALAAVTRLVAAGAMAILLAACSPGTGTGPYQPAPTSAPTEDASGTQEISLGQDAALGGYLVGPDGRTLYVLTTDTPGASTCAAGCATTWPPLVIHADQSPHGGPGVTGTLASIQRADGTTQVTYDGAPLYYYAGDAAAGNVNGQGLGGVWFVASPDGGPNVGPDASPRATKDSNY